MGQFEREYREALDGLGFSGEGKERIMKNLMERAEGPVKGKRFRTMRAALIAAALCLALVGTAFAAAWALGRVEVVNKAHDPLHAGYSVMGEVGRFPMERFSGTLREDAAAGKHFAGMEDWQSVKNYVGLPLMDSGLLMEDSAHMGIFTDGAPFGVSLMGLEDGRARALKEGEPPQVVRVLTESVVANWAVAVTVFAATEYADLEQGLPGLWMEYPEGYVGPTAHSFTAGDYKMACGETAIIVDEGLDFNIAYFAHDGLLYQLRALGVADPEMGYITGREVLLMALDSFAP